MHVNSIKNGRATKFDFQSSDRETIEISPAWTEVLTDSTWLMDRVVISVIISANKNICSSIRLRSIFELFLVRWISQCSSVSGDRRNSSLYPIVVTIPVFHIIQMQIVCSSGTLVPTYQTTRCYNQKTTIWTSFVHHSVLGNTWQIFHHYCRVLSILVCVVLSFSSIFIVTNVIDANKPR
jgi:hypothetical protein